MNRLDKVLAQVQPAYEIPEMDLVGEVLIPAMSVSDRVDIAVGYFTSQCISQIAPGLASLVQRSVKCRLLISPELPVEDRLAIERGLSTPEEAVSKFMVERFRDPSGMAAHVTDCLAYLVARGTLQIRCVLMRQGMFHKKVWLFEGDGCRASVHGSGNLTARGLLVNGEQMTIDRPWMDGRSSVERVDSFFESFEQEWTNQKEDRLTIEPRQLLDLLRTRGASSVSAPSIADFWLAWTREHDLGLAPPLPPGMENPPNAKRLRIPPALDWHNPPYAHQSAAVSALASCGFVGLVAMATGGGKTKTALIAATQVQALVSGPVLIVIVVPTTVLVHQWSEDVSEFGVTPVALSGLLASDRADALANAEASLRSGDPRTEVLITTLKLFTADEALKTFVRRSAESSTTLLVADEVHNFGAPGFVNDLPESFKYRIGLSATPVRQYDAEGTKTLFQFFRTEGEPTFSFTLRDAIRAGCLTPYRYHLHPVELTDEEMERYSELSEELRRTGLGRDDGVDVGLTERQKRLLRERRALVEQAEGKIGALGVILREQQDDLSHTLIYCSAKAVMSPHDGRQIDHVRRLLRDLRISTHMYTAVESGATDSRRFLDDFAKGQYQTLLAMKVLDEGVDLPATRQAFLLASSTVEREWVQRRGRVLRNSPGKTSADLHDFLVLPRDTGEPDGKSLVSAELRRAEHFAADAENKYDDNGPNDVIRSIERR